jgi:hypothetical protein
LIELETAWLGHATPEPEMCDILVSKFVFERVTTCVPLRFGKFYHPSNARMWFYGDDDVVGLCTLESS